MSGKGVATLFGVRRIVKGHRRQGFLDRVGQTVPGYGFILKQVAEFRQNLILFVAFQGDKLAEVIMLNVHNSPAHDLHNLGDLLLSSPFNLFLDPALASGVESWQAERSGRTLREVKQHGYEVRSK